MMFKKQCFKGLSLIGSMCSMSTFGLGSPEIAEEYRFPYTPIVTLGQLTNRDVIYTRLDTYFSQVQALVATSNPVVDAMPAPYYSAAVTGRADVSLFEYHAVDFPCSSGGAQRVFVATSEALRGGRWLASMPTQADAISLAQHVCKINAVNDTCWTGKVTYSFCPTILDSYHPFTFFGVVYEKPTDDPAIIHQSDLSILVKGN